jgi:hypothetical protein
MSKQHQGINQYRWNVTVSYYVNDAYTMGGRGQRGAKEIHLAWLSKLHSIGSLSLFFFFFFFFFFFLGFSCYFEKYSTF